MEEKATPRTGQKNTTEETQSETLTRLFDSIIRKQEKAVLSSEFKDISGNDMRILAVIGTEEARNMSSVAKDLHVTVGTLTIAVNNLVKKGYVKRVRSEEDRRVVLISLLAKGRRARQHFRDFHEAMVEAALTDLDESQAEALLIALRNLDAFFEGYAK